MLGLAVADAPKHKDRPFIIPITEAQTVTLFIAMGTQWRSAPAGVMGLDYNALEAVAKMLEIEITPEIFMGIRIMEAEVLTWIKEQR